MDTSTKARLNGRMGEALACGFLRAKGYFILARNYRNGFGEIDVIACKGELALIVEVKFREANSFETPDETLHMSQINRMVDTAEKWMEESLWEGGVRFDAIMVTEKHKGFEIMHLEDLL